MQKVTLENQTTPIFHNVQVAVRVRPLASGYHPTNGGNQLIQENEEKQNIKRCIREVIDDKIIILETKDCERFTFDFVANEYTSIITPNKSNKIPQIRYRYKYKK